MLPLGIFPLLFSSASLLRWSNDFHAQANQVPKYLPVSVLVLVLLWTRVQGRDFLLLQIRNHVVSEPILENGWFSLRHQRAA